MKSKKITEEQICENLERCDHFYSCSQNLCPLDLALHLRVGGERDKCRWMRETRRMKIKGREFTSGGRVAPTAVLKFVPAGNVERLNTFSRERWREIHK